MLLTGALAWLSVVLPVMLVTLWLDSLLEGVWQGLFAIVVLYLAIGWRSLLEHAARVSEPLGRGDLKTARQALAMMVSRDVETLDEAGIARAASESVLENGSDAIFAPLFWFALAGVPGVVLYRLTNTLDAMWGYKNERYLYFGRCAARLDDLLNWIPARLTALGYALAGWRRQRAKSTFCQSLRCWREQGRHWKSPNAGPVMAAGAGSLGVRLGGDSRYHGEIQRRPPLGAGRAPDANTLRHACRLVDRTLVIWLAGTALVTLGLMS